MSPPISLASQQRLHACGALYDARDAFAPKSSAWWIPRAVYMYPSDAVRGHSSSFFLISFPDLWLTSPLHVMTWHMNDDVAVVWTSTALRANRYSCTLVWAEWVRAHEGWRKDGFGRELDPQSCTTGKSIPVCGLTELAGDFSICFHFEPLIDNPVIDMLRELNQRHCF